MNHQLISAIKQKLALQLHYQGFRRIVEPHTYGLDHDGVAKLSCFQTSGGGSLNLPVGWEILNVADIFALEITDIVFLNGRPGYKEDDPTFSTIYAQVQLRGLADWRG